MFSDFKSRKQNDTNKKANTLYNFRLSGSILYWDGSSVGNASVPLQGPLPALELCVCATAPGTRPQEARSSQIGWQTEKGIEWSMASLLVHTHRCPGRSGLRREHRNLAALVVSLHLRGQVTHFQGHLSGLSASCKFRLNMISIVALKGAFIFNFELVMEGKLPFVWLVIPEVFKG